MSSPYTARDEEESRMSRLARSESLRLSHLATPESASDLNGSRSLRVNDLNGSRPLRVSDLDTPESASDLNGSRPLRVSDLDTPESARAARASNLAAEAARRDPVFKMFKTQLTENIHKFSDEDYRYMTNFVVENIVKEGEEFRFGVFDILSVSSRPFEKKFEMIWNLAIELQKRRLAVLMEQFRQRERNN